MKNNLDPIENAIYKALYFIFLEIPYEFAKCFVPDKKDPYKRDSKGRFKKAKKKVKDDDWFKNDRRIFKDGVIVGIREVK